MSFNRHTHDLRPLPRRFATLGAILFLLLVAGRLAADVPVNFANQVLDSRLVLAPDGSPLVGTNYRAQLFLVTGPAFTPVEPAMRFRTETTVNPGTWSGRSVTLPGVAEGEPVQLAVGVWDDTLFPTLDDAIRGRGIAGRSAPFPYVFAPSEPPTVQDTWMKRFPGLALLDYAKVPPTLDPPQLAPLPELVPAQGQLTASFAGQPAPGTVFELLGGPAGFVLDSTGAWSWTPTEAQGPETFAVQVVTRDAGPSGASATNRFKVTATELNLPPEFLVTDSAVDELKPLSLLLTATDTDLPAQPLSYALIHGPAGLNVSPGGVVAWTPTEEQGPGDFAVLVRVSDGSATTEASFTLRVTDVNSAPTFAAIPPPTLGLTDALRLQLPGLDSDVPAQALSFALVSGPAGLAVSTAGEVTWTPTDEQRPSTNAVQVTVSDGSVTTAGSFTVVALEPPPNPVNFAGLAVDGYIAHGTVFFDANRNGVPDGREPVTNSDARGRFDLPVDLNRFDTDHSGVLEPAEGRLVITGGTDLATGLPLTLPLTAPPGSEVISPLSTLVEALVRPGGLTSVAEAETAIRASLSLPEGISLTHFDPLAGVAAGDDARATELLRANSQVQDTVVQLTAALQTGGEAPAPSAVMNALAAQISLGRMVDLGQAAPVASLLADAAKNAGVTVTPEVGAAAAFVVSSLNEAKEAALSESGTGLDALAAVSRLQTQAQGSSATALAAAARGEVSGDEVVAANSGSALGDTLAGLPVGNLLAQPTPPGEFEFGGPAFTVGENGRSAAPVTIVRRGGSSGTVTVRVSLADGTAQVGTDVADGPLEVTFGDGEIIRTLDLSQTTKQDDLPEGTETLTLRLGLTAEAPTGARLGVRTSAILSLQDDDIAGTFQFAAAHFEVREDGQRLVPILVHRTEGLAGSVTVRITPRALPDGATADMDFVAAPVDVTFPAGVSQRIVEIPVLADADAESAEALALDLTLTEPSAGAQLGPITTAELVIRDDDLPPEPGRVAARAGDGDTPAPAGSRDQRGALPPGGQLQPARLATGSLRDLARGCATGSRFTDAVRHGVPLLPRAARQRTLSGRARTLPTCGRQQAGSGRWPADSRRDAGGTLPTPTPHPRPGHAGLKMREERDCCEVGSPYFPRRLNGHLVGA